jgi:FixJ family two-component response regulator
MKAIFDICWSSLAIHYPGAGLPRKRRRLFFLSAVSCFLDAVNVGLARDRARRENQAVVSALRARFDLLTARERAILTHVAAGRLNKQIAADLGITETTVKVHRSNAMRKIKASSLSELCRIVDKLKLPPDIESS